jgi:hypothetical protein
MFEGYFNVVRPLMKDPALNAAVVSLFTHAREQK